MLPHLSCRSIPVVVVCLLLASSALADVELPSVFSSGMVLQRDRALPIWGWAEPGEKVTVEIAGRARSATADEKGRWKVVLEPLSARKSPLTMAIRGNNRIRLSGILVGEVWVASGQSNMEWPVSRSDRPPRGAGRANPQVIRLFTTPHVAVDGPQSSVTATWTSAKESRAVNAFSAVAWYFACEISRGTGVPVGILNSTWGGTAVLPWTPAPGPFCPRWGGAKTVGPRASGALFNGMISPLVPFAIRGAIWYQGESDAGHAALYRDRFGTMIRRWREIWGQGSFPFYFVQLANFRKRLPEPSGSAWADLREAQLETLASVENTGMAVTIDIGQANDIHPRNKYDVGRRLALWALAKDYGKKVICSGPIFAGCEVKGDRIIVRFDHEGGGLRAKGGRRLSGFAVAGSDRRFVWARAKIEGKTVVVSHPKIQAPVAVRYAWADNPECNLANAQGLPASPFRTDDWPLGGR